MNFREVLETGEDSFQLAPLIDVVFLLLTFFILTGALEAQERESPIELPDTTAAILRRRGRQDIVVNVTRKGRIWVDNRSFSVGELRRNLIMLQRSARSEPVSVIIRADERTLHRYVMRVIDACAAANVKNVSFVSKDARKKSIR